MKNLKTGRVVLITGESSGFGMEMAKLFIANGDTVCGLSTHPFEMDGVYHQVGDISNEEDCKRIISNIIDKYGRIDVLINNAGFGIFGPIEETPVDKAKRQMEVSFLGAYLMAKSVTPYMRKNGAGKIINISSIGAVVPLPYQGFYSAAKAAMDTLFDAYRSELRPFNIQICSIKPGDAKTNFTKNRNLNDLKSDSPYKQSYQRCLTMISKDEQNGVPALKIAKKAFKVSKKKRMPYSRKVGAKDTFLSWLFKVLPSKLRNYIVYQIYAK